MLNDKKEESHNHYIPLKSKNNNIELNKEKRDEIKKSLKIIENKSKEIVKSIITGKIRGLRIGKSYWSPLYN